MRLCKPRIPPVNEKELTYEQREVLETLEPRRRSFNVYKTLARHPKLAQRFVSTIRYILSESTFCHPRSRATDSAHWLAVPVGI